MTELEAHDVRAASLSDVGLRRATNQDSYGEFEHASGLRLWVVADGMGGHRGGETASRVAVEAMGRVFGEADPGTAPLELLRTAFERANAEVHDLASRTPELAGMGTTGVALLLHDGSAWVGHVGDSRAYRMRGGHLEALTQDHSLVAELQRRGFVTAEEAAVHPRRNEVLRSIGIEPEVEADLAAIPVEPGDRFLLCSDGLCGVVPEEEIAPVLAGEVPEQAVRRLVDLAIAHGAPDNVTVQVVTIGEAAPAVTRAPARASGPRPGVRRVALSAALVTALLLAGLLLLLVSGLSRR
jgi:protein phosphatase